MPQTLCNALFGEQPARLQWKSSLDVPGIKSGTAIFFSFLTGAGSWSVFLFERTKGLGYVTCVVGAEKARTSGVSNITIETLLCLFFAVRYPSLDVSSRRSSVRRRTSEAENLQLLTDLLALISPLVNVKRWTRETEFCSSFFGKNLSTLISKVLVVGGPELCSFSACPGD